MGLVQDDAEAQTSLLQLHSHVTPENIKPYYWSSRGGNAATSSYVPYTAPTDFSPGPSWVWKNEGLEQVRFSPLIDSDMNIYVCSTFRIRKFNSDGDLLWTWHTAEEDGSMSTSPALYKGAILALPQNGQRPTAISIGMGDGAINWKHPFENHQTGGEASSLTVDDDRMFFGANDGGDGTSIVVAANASDGSYLWEYVAGDIMWNFAASAPGDGTLLFSSNCGVAFRISFDGQLIWKTGESYPGVNCGCGGGALGPNGVFYAEFNRPESRDDGFVAAYQVTDGSLLWEQNFERLGGEQYPAVGKLGTDGPLAVVVALGNFANGQAGGANNTVFALDAMTGETLWHSEEEPWYIPFSAGENETHGEGEGFMCRPDPQGIPVIASDGTVYASSSHGGELRAIRDTNGNGIIEDTDVSTFETHNCFLNSPSVAPGMLVAAPCWGPMYVFKETTQ